MQAQPAQDAIQWRLQAMQHLQSRCLHAASLLRNLFSSDSLYRCTSSAGAISGTYST